MARGRDILEQVWQHLQNQIDILQQDVASLKAKIGGSDLPTRALMLHSESLVLVGNALSLTQSTTAYMNMYAAQTAAAIGDTFTNNFSVKSGTYSINVYGVSGTDCGTVTWYLDNTSIGSTDIYGGSAVLVKYVLAATILTDGVHVLKGVVEGRNPSSSGYKANLSIITVVPQVD